MVSWKWFTVTTSDSTPLVVELLNPLPCFLTNCLLTWEYQKPAGQMVRKKHVHKHEQCIKSKILIWEKLYYEKTRP